MPNTVWGILGLNDQFASVSDVGEQRIFTAVNQLAAAQSAEVEAISRMLVESDTTRHTEYYYIPTGGRMQEAGRLTRPGAVKGLNRYSVGYPLRDARDQVAYDDISIAYMSVTEVQAHISTVFNRHMDWVRYHQLRAIFNKTNEVFADETENMEITVRRLANTDGTPYPPLFGYDIQDSLTDHNHYLVSGYAAAAISDINNPFPVLRNHIAEHFGQGVDVVVFVNPDHEAVISALTGFVEAGDPALSQPATETALVGRAPRVPGVIAGRVNRTWVSLWQSIPPNYMFAFDPTLAPPLKRRIDRATGIMGRGQLSLVARQTEFPLQESFWRDRRGYGVGNRLNGVAMELTVDVTYDTPAEFI